MLALAWFAVAPATAATVLAWDTQEADLHPAPSAETAVASYHFTNRAAVPVTVTAIKTSCGCTTATLDKKRYEPGEQGVIVATFAVGDRSGVQHKRIEVDTDHPDEAVIALGLTVHLPEAPVLDPQFLRWRLGGPATAQTIAVALPAGSPLTIIGAISSPPLFTVSAAIAVDAHSAVITVIPTRTDTPLTGSVTVVCSGERRYHAFAKIEAAPAPAEPSPPAAR